MKTWQLQKQLLKKGYTNFWGILSGCMCVSILVPISASFYLTIFKMHNNHQRHNEVAYLSF